MSTSDTGDFFALLGLLRIVAVSGVKFYLKAYEQILPLLGVRRNFLPARRRALPGLRSAFLLLEFVNAEI